MRFGVPMVWRELKNHDEGCCFCMVDMTGWNQRKKKDWYYPDIESARRPIPHCTEVPPPVLIIQNHTSELFFNYNKPGI